MTVSLVSKNFHLFASPAPVVRFVSSPRENLRRKAARGDADLPEAFGVCWERHGKLMGKYRRKHRNIIGNIMGKS